MEDMKPETTGSNSAEVVVAEPEVTEMTRDEFTRRIETDVKFADDYLNHRLKIEDVSQEPEKASEPEQKPRPTAIEPMKEAPTPAPTEKQEPAVSKTDDGKFVVDFEDGSTPQVYKTKNEAMKGLREKELYIRRQKEVINEMKAREAKLLQEVEKLKAHNPEKQPEKVESKTESKSNEPVDLYDPENQKKLVERILAHEQEIERLKRDREEDKVSTKKEKEERQRQEETEKIIKKQYEEASVFVARHPELKTERPIEVIDREYRLFLDEIGLIAGTDGSPRQNLAIMDLYLDATSEQGKKVREQAERTGRRPPAELEKYFQVLNLLNEKSHLQKRDPVTGQMIPFTLEETYRYLQIRDGDTAAPAAVAPQAIQPVPDNVIPLNPKAEAIRAAENRARQVATDIQPGGATAPASISELNESQIGQILDTPKSVLLTDAAARRRWEDAYKHLRITPPRLDGI